MELYLAYIPFTTQNAIMQTNGSADPYFKIADATFYKSVEVQNFRILDNGKISFIIDLKESSIENLDYDNYNAVVTKVYKSKYKVYRIKSISYTSATNYLITAVSHYVDAIYGENQQLIDPTSLKSHVSKIKYGYAYDSLVTNTGSINLDSNGSGDIYIHNPKYQKPNLPIYRQKIPLDYCYNNTTLDSLDKTKINNVLNDYLEGWLLIYFKPGAEVNGEENHFLPNCVYMNDDMYRRRYENDAILNTGISMPFSVLCAPIFNYTKLNTAKISLNFKGVNNHRILTAEELATGYKGLVKDGSAWVLYSKVVRLLPFKNELFASYTETTVVGVETKEIIIGLNINDIPSSSSPTYLTDYTITASGGSVSSIAISNLDGRTHKSIAIANSVLTSNGFYPKGYGVGATISKSDFKDYRYNPYVTANTFSLGVRDNVGGEYVYTPLHLGHFDNLKFNLIESLTPDITKHYVWVDPDSTTDGLIKNHYPKETFKGLINNVDFSFPFSVDQLDTFLANNKNFFMREAFKIGTGMVSSMTNSLVKTDGISTMGSKALFGAVTEIADINFQIDNMDNAPETVSNMNGNVFFAMQYEGLRFSFVIYTATDLIKQTMYNDFVAKGLYLNRYISKNEVHKYVSITDNAYDKSYYKYCEGDFDFYVETENGDYVNNKNIVEIKNLYANGTAIYNVPLIITDNPLIDFKPYQSNYELAVIDKGDEGEIN